MRGDPMSRSTLRSSPSRIAGGRVALVMSPGLFDNNGSAGIACSGPSTTCTFIGNTVRGLGPVDDQLQAGINIRGGALATSRGNVITDHFFLPGNGLPNWSVGIFLVGPDPAPVAAP